MKRSAGLPTRISLFGHFGLDSGRSFGNLGNEATLQAFIDCLRRLAPETEITCICTDPKAASASYCIAAAPISRSFVAGWIPKSRTSWLLRKILVGAPSEVCRWLERIATLRHSEALVIPGTGLLTDAYGLGGWGPSGLFKWALAAKLCGCKLLLVSVGAGPLNTRAGRRFIKAVLRLSDFCSYRDKETKDYLASIGVAAPNERVYPDLAYSLPEAMLKKCNPERAQTRVVGIGVMQYHGKLSSDNEPDTTYLSYLQQLAILTEWLLSRGYLVRLLIGDLGDKSITTDLKEILDSRLEHQGLIIDEPPRSVSELLVQIGQTDVVVATRFHNILLALMLNKPVISISFHQKCRSLMKDMGLEEYCQDIRNLNAAMLIEQFSKIEDNAEVIKNTIAKGVRDRRQQLEQQYALIVSHALGNRVACQSD